jgi:putative redox protein
MEALLLSVGGCMGVDIQAILEKGRVPLEALEVELEGERAPDPPQRFLTLRMDIRVKGPDEEQRAKVERAVQLSRDKYCSVFHSLQPDLKVTVAVHLE